MLCFINRVSMFLPQLVLKGLLKIGRTVKRRKDAWKRTAVAIDMFDTL